jgi:hypothetical protein
MRALGSRGRGSRRILSRAVSCRAVRSTVLVDLLQGLAPSRIAVSTDVAADGPAVRAAKLTTT